MNADELAVDDMAVRILALRQPVGRDLRFTIAAVKVVTDLERIGDEAVNLAERAREMSTMEDRENLPIDLLRRMARTANSMVHEALDSFVDEDPSKARAVMARDDEVDDLYGEVLRASIEFMSKNSDRIHDGMLVSNCAKYLERIADHSTNIAEMVVFLAAGIDIRHQGKKV
jgi:phosphate transport system protein